MYHLGGGVCWGWGYVVGMLHWFGTNPIENILFFAKLLGIYGFGRGWRSKLGVKQENQGLINVLCLGSSKCGMLYVLSATLALTCQSIHINYYVFLM